MRRAGGPHAQSWGKVVVGEMRSELGRSCCRENASRKGRGGGKECKGDDVEENEEKNEDAEDEEDEEGEDGDTRGARLLTLDNADTGNPIAIKSK